MSKNPRRIVASVIAWLIGALAALGVGQLALSLIGSGFTSDTVQPLTPQAVSEAVGATRSPSAGDHHAGGDPSSAPDDSSTPGSEHDHSGDGSASAAPTATASVGTGQGRLISSAGGTVIARCDAGKAYLVSWSPEPGYHAHDVHRGPAAWVSVSFETGGHEVTLAVQCVAGVPQRGTQTGEDH